MNWSPDAATLSWAQRFRPVMPKQPAPQYPGHLVKPLNWQAPRILAAQFPDFCCETNGAAGQVQCSPENIIECFQRRLWLEGAALVVSWGNMDRRPGPLRKVYRPGLNQVQEAIAAARDALQHHRRGANTKSARPAWEILISRLSWSAIMASKTLHFLCRACGEEQNPLVPIDGAAIRRCLWPAFKTRITESRKSGVHGEMPGAWWGNTWEAYNRYMTVVNVWSAAQGWTTIEWETTLFQMFRDQKELHWTA